MKFWSRFTLWVLFALVLPLIYIFVRTNLFYTVNKVSIWLLIVILVVFLFVRQLWKYLKNGIPYSMGVQVISGVVKIILPLLALYSVILIFRLKVDEVVTAAKGIEQFLIILIPCQMIAIPINPMPQWVYENKEKRLAQIIQKVRGE